MQHLFALPSLTWEASDEIKKKGELCINKLIFLHQIIKYDSCRTPCWRERSLILKCSRIVYSRLLE